jgi:hypothetical protein
MPRQRANDLGELRHVGSDPAREIGFDDQQTRRIGRRNYLGGQGFGTGTSGPSARQSA